MDFRHTESLGLFGGFNGIGRKPFKIDAADIGMACADRPDAAGSQFRGFFGNQVCPVALDGGEQEPQVWHIFLRTKQFFEFCRAVILGESFDTPQPFAIPPVEKGNFHPGGETQYIPEIMHLRNRQRDSLSKRKIFRDIKACAKRQGHNRAG